MSAAANAVTVEKAYEAFEKLDANAAEAESSYLLLLDGVKGEPKVKQLCAQFIPRFFGKFPKLQEQALNAILDLCEDESNVIRLNAIPALAEICKASPKHTKQIADVMAQLLISEASELALVKKNFTSLFKLDAKVAFESLFQQVREGEENLRANCLTFLKEQIGEQKSNIATDESLQKSIADGVKSVIGAENGVSSDELKSFIEVLRGLKIYSTDKELPSTVAAIIASQAGLQKPFEPTNDAAIQNLISCVQMAARLNPPRARRPKSAADSKEEVKEEENKTVDNSAFLLFFKDKILPVFSQVSEPNKLSLLKTFADAARSATANTAAAIFPSIVELVKVYASGEAAGAAAAESAAAEPSKPTPISAGTPGPKINYSLVEALLVLFHRLGSKNHNSVKEVAGLFTPTGQPSDFRPTLREKREALVAKLKVAVDSVGPYLTSLKAVSQKLKEKRQESKDDAEKKNLSEKLTSLNLANRTAENVNRLASALMKASPEIINLVPSSWGARPPKKGPAGAVAGKKRTGSAGPAAAGQKRTKGDTSANNAGSKRSNSQTRGGGSARGRRGAGNKRVNTGGNNNSGGAGQGAGSRSNSRGRSGPRGRGRGRGRRGQ